MLVWTKGKLAEPPHLEWDVLGGAIPLTSTNFCCGFKGELAHPPKDVLAAL